MEAIEFFLLRGKVYYLTGEERKTLTPGNTEVVDFLHDKIVGLYPIAMKRLRDMYSEYSFNGRFYRYKIVERFIRCNFAESDFLRPDISRGNLHFEEVRCPLRGICKDEGVICNPQISAALSRRELEVVTLYCHGFGPAEIATRTNKSLKTVNNQIQKIKNKLKLNTARDIIKVFALYDFSVNNPIL